MKRHRNLVAFLRLGRLLNRSASLAILAGSQIDKFAGGVSYIPVMGPEVTIDHGPADAVVRRFTTQKRKAIAKWRFSTSVRVLDFV